MILTGFNGASLSRPPTGLLTQYETNVGPGPGFPELYTLEYEHTLRKEPLTLEKGPN